MNEICFGVSLPIFTRTLDYNIYIQIQVILVVTVVGYQTFIFDANVNELYTKKVT